MNENKPASPGDMDSEEFRHFGHKVVDWIADYLSHTDRYPVLSQVEPGALKRALPESAPSSGESMEKILADFDRLIPPGVTHWNHPGFFAYFAVSGSAPGILGEMFSAAFNVNAMMWRTSPAATELEEVTLNWLRQMIGLSEDFSGVIYDTASISTLCAIAAAREAVPGLRVREQGLGSISQPPVEADVESFPGYPFLGADAEDKDENEDPDIEPIFQRLRLYTSEHAHSSVEKAAITLGIGQEGVRQIATDSEFRMDPAALARAIQEDREAGWRPFCVVATVGTTSTTSIDPVPQIAEICELEGLWLHVDAAYGGPAAILPEMKWVLAGCERADSLVMNPHKWLFVPIDISALFCRRMDVLGQAFSLIPEYLRSNDSSEVKNYMDYGPQLGRRFRAIKLWFVLRYFGVDGIAERIRNHIEMAREFAGWVDASPDFERMAPTPFSLVCFRARPYDLNGASEDEIETRLDWLNERLMEEVNREGKVFLSHTKLNGKYTLRLAIGNIKTTPAHVRLAWDSLRSVVSGLLGREAD